MTTYKIIYVRWVDSALQSDWVKAPSESTGTSEIESIGFLIHEDKEHIEIAQNMTPYHKCAIMAIPKTVIKEIKKVKIKK
jgi:glutamate formiminotransferase